VERLIVTSDGFDSLRACVSVRGEKAATLACCFPNRLIEQRSSRGRGGKSEARGREPISLFVSPIKVWERNEILAHVCTFVHWPRLSSGMLPDIVDELKNRHVCDYRIIG